MSSRIARPAYNPWRDIEATHIPDGCGVKQVVEVDRLYRRRAKPGRRSSVGVGATGCMCASRAKPGRSACGHTLVRVIEGDSHDR